MTVDVVAGADDVTGLAVPIGKRTEDSIAEV